MTTTPAETVLLPSRDAYGLTVYEVRGARALVGDGTDRFWVDSEALDWPETPAPALSAPYEERAAYCAAYAEWCDAASAEDA